MSKTPSLWQAPRPPTPLPPGTHRLGSPPCACPNHRRRRSDATRRRLPRLPASLGDELRGEERFSGPCANDRHGGIGGRAFFKAIGVAFLRAQPCWLRIRDGWGAALLLVIWKHRQSIQFARNINHCSPKAWFGKRSGHPGPHRALSSYEFFDFLSDVAGAGATRSSSSPRSGRLRKRRGSCRRRPAR